MTMTEVNDTGTFSLLFIPDISGFTKFVTAVEIDHSQHIIAELLEIIFDSNRLGTKHICVVNAKELEFETVTNDFGEKKRVYGERLKNAPLMKEVINYFILQPRTGAGGTTLRVESHYFPIPFFGRLVVPFFKSAISKNLDNLLNSIKKYSENKEDVDE